MNSIQLALVILSLGILLMNCQTQKKVRGKVKPKRGPGRKGGIAGAIDNAMFKALTINYPLKFFQLDYVSDWRKKAKFSDELVRSSEGRRAWSDFSYAQDQEDVWLYENWFYGMADGVIMESGALNGLLFSTSYMFEKFANWTAIHVGQS
jgi:hypothetical protein